jgi:hypothetical protein
MAEWNSGTSYSPGASVTYLGLPYLRSQYPLTSTAGTNPKEEVSVDPKGDVIRTWELRVPSPYSTTYAFHIGYFSLKAPERSDGIYTKLPPLSSYPGKFAPEHPFAGGSDFQLSAYEYTPNPPEDYIVGSSLEMDQFRAEIAPVPPSTTPIPSAPAMLAAKCGVAMQQNQEVTPPLNYQPTSSASANSGILVYQNLTYDSIDDEWYQDFGATPRIFYVFLFFNHPLYFRRQHTITFRISTLNYTGGYYVPDTDPPVIVPPTEEGVYSSYTTSVTGTDENFWSSGFNLNDFIKPANAIATYTLPDNETTPGPYGSIDGTNYELVEVFISDIESND